MRISRTVRTLTVAVALAALSPVVAPAVAHGNPHRSQVQPLERAHAHNDYEHERPLLDALDHGFTSAEADVWLVAGELYIGHDAPDPTRTLANTYLEPLARRFRENGGSIYPHWKTAFRLMIDVKTDGPAAWPVIEGELARFPQLMTTYRRGRVLPGAVTAVVSGNRDLPAMQAATVRRTFYDGRLGDLTSGLPSTVMAMVSDNWTRHFTWLGVGEMPEAERAKLRTIVATAHTNGYDVRFWATPDAPGEARTAIWRELLTADVDAINTDDLAGLQEFLLTEDPAEASAA
ncbi:phosphatidylinositol-specific phospholipase C/glycerophosphodiester phosphodiesterase family protein [soil metagenome]